MESLFEYLKKPLDCAKTLIQKNDCIIDYELFKTITNLKNELVYNYEIFHFQIDMNLTKTEESKMYLI